LQNYVFFNGKTRIRQKQNILPKEVISGDKIVKRCEGPLVEHLILVSQSTACLLPFAVSHLCGGRGFGCGGEGFGRGFGDNPRRGGNDI